MIIYKDIYLVISIMTIYAIEINMFPLYKRNFVPGHANTLQRGATSRGRTRQPKAKIINQCARFPVPMTNTISPNFGHLYTLRPG